MLENNITNMISKNSWNKIHYELEEILDHLNYILLSKNDKSEKATCLLKLKNLLEVIMSYFTLSHHEGEKEFMEEDLYWNEELKEISEGENNVEYLIR